MKVFIKILFASIISASSCFNLLAQQEFSPDSINVSEEIATGHVFVDGVYIEPPYIVRKEGWKIFINDLLVLDYLKPQNPFNFSEKPKAIFNELDKTSDLSDIFEIKDTTYNMPLAIVIGAYYLEKYEYLVACDSVVEFYKSLPNIKTCTKLCGSDDSFELVSFNEESRVISLQPYGRKHNQDFGPNQNPDKEKEINRFVTLFFNDYCSDLRTDNLLIYFKSEGGYRGFQRVRIKPLKIKDFCNILLSEDNHKQKVDLLTNIVMDRVFAEKVVTTLVDKSILIRILKQTSNGLENKTK